MRGFNDAEDAALRRIQARLEMELEVSSQYGATIALLEEELQLVREILAGGGAIDEPAGEE